MERATGFEPATSTLGRWHSTTELRPPVPRPRLRLRGRPPILIITAVAIKRNLPVLAALALVAAGVLALAVALRRSDDELVREAAAKHAAPLGTVTDIRVHGPVADIEFSTRPLLHAEFRKDRGAWTFSKDLAADFEQRMKDPAASAEVLQHLAQKIADADKVSVSLKEGIGYQYRVIRNGEDLVAEVHVKFSYPRGGDRPGSGLFVEGFQYADGTWRSVSTHLLKQAPTPRK